MSWRPQAVACLTWRHSSAAAAAAAAAAVAASLGSSLRLDPEGHGIQSLFSWRVWYLVSFDAARGRHNLTQAPSFGSFNQPPPVAAL